MMRAILAVAAATMIAASFAHAQQTTIPGVGMRDPNAPIEWSADKFDADANSKSATYTGNVLIKQGDVRIHADTVHVNIVNGKPDKIRANGHVVVDAPSGTATGDSGVYDVNPRIVTLYGRVVLTKDKNVMRGPVLTVNLITGVASLVGKQGQLGRVQGLIVPASQKPEADQNP